MSAIRIGRDAGVMTITIDRPQALNALDPDAHRAMHEAFDAFATDEALRVAVVTGTGERAFCVGSDLKVRAAMGGDDMPPPGFAGLTECFDLDKPVIAAVNGLALGGGMEIVLACDLAIAVEGARFALPEVKVGLAAAGGLHRLARQLPSKRAMEVALTGRMLEASDALEFGLINEVVPAGGLSEATARWTELLLANAPLSLQASKQMMLDGLAKPSLEEAFAGTYPAYEKMLTSEDAVEGSRAFIEKRKPEWKGS